ncbi:MAG: phosphoribosylamine--glycine ligase [Verrucomicrobia bacterium]|nr:phosphoribosylamine--glycine ligase [Verrucomicrobiota bacterium]
MVLGVGGFAQAVMQILSDDGAEVSCALTRDYAHDAPAFAGPTHDLASTESLADLIERQSVDLVVPMSIDWAKAPWAGSLLGSRAAVFSPTGEAMRIERDRDFARQLCQRYGVPFPAAHVAHTRLAALEFLDCNPRAFVIKNPLCSPNSPVHTIVCETHGDSRAWLERVNYDEGVFLQEYLGRREAGHIALVANGEVYSLVTNQEYKRAHAGNMGIVAGGPLGGLAQADPADRYGLAKALLHPLKPWFAETGYTGPIQATGIFCDGQWHAIEYNIRLGITATPMILRMLEHPVALLMRLASGEPPGVRFRTGREFGASMTLAGYGYPFVQLEGPTVPVTLDGKLTCDVWWNEVASGDGGSLLATGHRVADVVAVGSDRSAALAVANENIRKIRCLGSYFRPDIGESLWPPGNE